MSSHSRPRQLGSLRDIRQRSSRCEMCALIVDSVGEAGTTPILTAQTRLDADADGEQPLGNARCSISWEMDGREASTSNSSGRRSGRRSGAKNTVRGLTRRVHIRWNNPRLSDAYLVYVAPDTFARTASDAHRVWTKDSLFLGRRVTEGIENQALIRSWLDLCQRSHRGPCREMSEARTRDFVEMVSHAYFGVIDVQTMQLTQLPLQGSTYLRGGGYNDVNLDLHSPYVALSYVWGSNETEYTTLTENVMVHRMHGGLEDVLLRLPRVIQDAIDLVRRLGFRYMWIDRLCIVQDSSRSWKLNAYNMDLIYGNAALTICAADGDASHGLRAMRPDTHNTRQYKRTIKPHLELMVTRPPEIYIRASEWNERAWTFQERLLSRRCLIFTNGKVYFQCRSTGMSEDIFGDQKGAGWSLDLVDAPLQMFRQLEDRAFWVYMKCVELYTERKLTKAKDVQAAFSGMANIMEERMRAPVIHGLPSSHFDLALLWQPVKSMKRRLIPDEGSAAAKQTSNLAIPDFPSWSWTGWIGHVKYHDGLFEGVLDNVSQWLDTRTWIRWWVRDGHGDLRPLWDCYESEEDMSREPNWRGYTKNRSPSGIPVVTAHGQPVQNTRGRRDGSPRTSSAWSSTSSLGSGSGTYKYDLNRYGRRRQISRHSRERCVYRSRPHVPERVQIVQHVNGVDDSGRRRGRFNSDLRRGADEQFGDGPAIYNMYEPRINITGPPPRTEYPTKLPPLPPNQGWLEYGTDPALQQRQRSTSPRNDGYENFEEGEAEGRYGYGDHQEERRPSRNPRRQRRGEELDYAQDQAHDSGFYDMIFKDDERAFNITLRDYPYRVVKAAFDPKPETSEFPLLPVLQFHTWHSWLFIKKKESVHVPSKGDEPDRHRQRRDPDLADGMGHGLARYDIADEAGDWCGSIVLDEEWAAQAGERQEFIAVSETKSFTPQECEEWTYYVPKERDQSEWDLFYVLLIERKEERWERVGVGKVFKEAFQNLKKKEIMLS